MISEVNISLQSMRTITASAMTLILTLRMPAKFVTIKGISAKIGWDDPIRPAAKLAHKDPPHTPPDADGCAPTAEIRLWRTSV